MRLALLFRGPSHHPRTVPGARRLRSSDDASFPGLSCPTTHAGTADPLPAGRPALRRATSEVWVPPSRRPPPSLREPCGPRASTGFPLRGVLLPSVGLPLGSPCPPAVARVDSPRPYRSVRTRPASGPCSRARARSVRRALAGPTRRCLPGLLPFRAFSPSVLASASWIRARSPITRWAGLTSRPACVSRSSGAEGSACPSRGCRLSWDSSPCNRHGITEDRRGGRAHGFASRLAACTRLESI